MTFTLSDSVRNDIIFAMENQNEMTVLDASSGRVHTGCDLVPDEENIYSLPKWTSDDGFALMEDFTEKCHSPSAKAELRECLQSGKGVFKGFKNILKKYPLVEKRWHLYKASRMDDVITEWYNTLREAWGLEMLDEDAEDIDTDDILEEDFTFEAYNEKRDRKDVKSAEEKVFEESLEGADDAALANALFKLRKSQAEAFSARHKSGFVCRLESKEFAGCALVSRDLTGTDTAFCITDLFVVKNYRGLGIGQHLLECTLDALKADGAQLVIASHPFISAPAEKLLVKLQFTKESRDFILRLHGSAQLP